MALAQRITPFLWFDGEAQEASAHYVATFPNSGVGAIARYDGAGARASGRPEGSVMTVEFELDGCKFVALNGGPMFKFNESVSFVVHCDSQAEIDHYWERLTADGGREAQCGWLRDRYGLSWQVVPAALPRLMAGGRGAKVMQAILGMKKIDLAALERAAA